MRYSELTGGRRLAALGAAAAVCIGLTACGAGSGITPGESGTTTPVISASTQKFCKEVATAMASLAGTNPSESMKLTVARKTLDSLLDNGIKSFTKLEPEAPANLRNSIKTIVADFKSYKVTASKAKSTKELLGETIAASPMEKAAYQQLLGYTGTSC